MTEDPFEFEQFENNQGGSTFDIKILIFKILRKSPFLLLSVVLGLLTVFIYHRYTVEKYRVSSTLLIPEENTAISSSLLENFSLDFNPDFMNELVILESKDLTRATLSELDFGISYYTKGRIKTIEEYKTLPFMILQGLNHPQIYGKEFKISFLENNQFRVTLGDDPDHDSSTIYPPFQKVDTDKYFFTVVFLRSTNLEGREFYFKMHSPEDLVNRYNSSLQVTYTRAFTSIADLSIIETSPKKGADFLNKLMEVYRSRELREKNLTAEKTIRFINTEMGRLNDTLNIVASQLDQVKVENRVLDVGQMGTRITSRLTALEVQRGVTESALQKLNENVDFLDDTSKYDQIVLPPAILEIDSDLGIYINRLTQLSVERREMRKSLADFNPEMRTKNAEIEGLAEAIKDAVLTRIRGLENQRETIQKEIDSYQGQFEKFPVTERRVSDIQRVYDLYYGMFLYFQQKRAEAGIVMASNSANTEVVDAANPNVRPFFPNIPMNTAFGAGIGLAIPLLIIVVRELLNDKIEYRKQVDHLTNIPVLGVIGHNSKPGNLAVLEHTKGMVAETFRSLRSNLSYFGARNKIKTILITSNASGEGKSFCSINLASILAIGGKKTILIGLDLRKPKIFGDFDLSNEIGISNYLAGFVEKKDIIQPTKFENLDIIAAGPVPPNPSELLMLDKLKNLIEELKTEYEYVIIDTPPIGIVSDTFNLTMLADLSLFVIRQNYTVKQVFQHLNELVQKEQIDNAALILNDFRAGGGYGYGYGYGYGQGYGYGYGYGYGSGYYEEEELPKRFSVRKLFKK